MPLALYPGTVALLFVDSFIEYDYSDIEYPIPFNTLYNDPSTHYVNYGERNALIPSFVGLGDVSPLAFEESNYIIVTGSSQNHVIPNVNMLLSAVYANCNVSMVFVDFGLDRRGLTLLTSTLTLIHSIHTALHSPAELYYRKFNFAHFPQWMSLQDNAIRGGYAWKVISYYDVLAQTQAVVVWSDGGNLWMDDITQDLKRVKENGIYSPYSGDTIQRWVHGKTRAFLAGHHMLRKLMINKGMCTGGYVLMDYNNAYAMNNVVLPLLQCVYTRKCVAPLGTSRENHRQDQAVLTALIHSAKIPAACSSHYKDHMSFHHDCHGDKCLKIRNSLLNGIAKRYGVAYSWSPCSTNKRHGELLLDKRTVGNPPLLQGIIVRVLLRRIDHAVVARHLLRNLPVQVVPVPVCAAVLVQHVHHGEGPQEPDVQPLLVRVQHQHVGIRVEPDDGAQRLFGGVVGTDEEAVVLGQGIVVVQLLQQHESTLRKSDSCLVHAREADRNAHGLVDVKTHGAQQVPVLLRDAVDGGVAQKDLRVMGEGDAHGVPRAVERVGDGGKQGNVVARDVHHEIGQETVDVGTHLRSDPLLLRCEDGVRLGVRRQGSSHFGHDAGTLEGLKECEEPDDLGVHGELGLGEGGQVALEEHASQLARSLLVAVGDQEHGVIGTRGGN